MHKRALTASMATLSALFLAASPALADQEFLGTEASIDWRLVVILSVLFIFVFHTVLEFVNRGR
jgi:fatty acid desaturase